MATSGRKGLKIQPNKACLKTKPHKCWQNLPQKYVNLQKLHGLLHFLPQPSNIFTQIYSAISVTFRNSSFQLARKVAAQMVNFSGKLPFESSANIASFNSTSTLSVLQTKSPLVSKTRISSSWAQKAEKKHTSKDGHTKRCVIMRTSRRACINSNELEGQLMGGSL